MIWTAIHKVSRQLLTALCSIALLIPVGRLAFACHNMKTGLSSVCCCTENAPNACAAGGYCDAHVSGYQDGCCAVSLQRVPPAAPGKATLDRASPEPLAATTAIYLWALPIPYASGPEGSLAVCTEPDRPLYLTTGRLRI